MREYGLLLSHILLFALCGKYGSAKPVFLDILRSVLVQLLHVLVLRQRCEKTSVG